MPNSYAMWGVLHGRGRAGLTAGLAAVLVSAGLAVPQAAHADSLHWHQPLGVPGMADFAGANLGNGVFGGAVLTSNVNGQAAEQGAGADSQALAYDAPASASASVPGPNFDRIYLTTTAAGQALHYGTPQGFGPAVPVSQAQSLTATQSQLLVTSVEGDSLLATTYGFGQGGQLVQQGAPVTLFTGPQPPVASWVAPGDVVINTGSGVAEVSRAGDGSWQPAVTIGPPDGRSIDPASVHATASGSELIVAFSDALDQNLYAAMDQGSGALGPVETLLSPGIPAGGSVTTRAPLTAVGPDGTLAVVAQTLDCAASAGDAQSSIDLWTASTNGPLAQSVVPDQPWSATGTSVVTALAAGDGEALVGFRDQHVTRDTTASYDAASCAGAGPTGEVDATYTDVADLTGVGEEAFGTSTGTLDATGGPSGQQVGIVLAHVWTDGSAVVYGYLSATTTPQLSDYSQRPDAGPIAVAPPRPVPVYAPVAGPGRGLAIDVSAQRARVVVAPGTAEHRGRQLITLTNPLAIAETVKVAEYPPGATLTGRHPTRAYADATVRLQPHAKARVTLLLTPAALRQLARSGRLRVVLRVTPTAKGRPSGLLVRPITVRRV